jgi:hypothetical protein
MQLFIFLEKELLLRTMISIRHRMWEYILEYALNRLIEFLFWIKKIDIILLSEWKSDRIESNNIVIP